MLTLSFTNVVQELNVPAKAMVHDPFPPMDASFVEVEVSESTH